ncbi:hypothetical protein [Nocardia sp. IFM 10818]
MPDTTVRADLPHTVGDLFDLLTELVGRIGDPAQRDALARRFAVYAHSIPALITALPPGDAGTAAVISSLRAAVHPRVRQMLDQDYGPIHRVRADDTWGMRCAVDDGDDDMLTWQLIGASDRAEVRRRAFELLDDIAAGTSDTIVVEIGPLDARKTGLDHLDVGFSGSIDDVREAVGEWDLELDGTSPFDEPERSHTPDMCGYDAGCTGCIADHREPSACDKDCTPDNCRWQQQSADAMRRPSEDL